MNKIKASQNKAEQVEINPELLQLKARFADLVRLRNKHVTMLNQLDQQLQNLDAEITKREMPKTV